MLDKKYKRSYRNEDWDLYASKVKKRDNYKCVECKRDQHEIVLQVHHLGYYPKFEPWEYPLSTCVSLCKGCRARAHRLIEPSGGWLLVAINDLGGLSGNCERVGCGKSIRYEHETYHPEWGYKIVGSTCIEYLTQDDQKLSSEVLKIYSSISKFIGDSEWIQKYSKRRIPYLQTKFNHHLISIYGTDRNFSFQIAIKERGKRWYKYGNFYKVKNKNLTQIKELAFIALKGILSQDVKEQELLRNIYISIRN